MDSPACKLQRGFAGAAIKICLKSKKKVITRGF
jgi:hypothetical protein